MFRKMRGWEWCALAALAAGALAGSAEAAIEISSIEELQKIGNDPNYPLDGDYVLTQDIDASETADWNEGKGFDPIGVITFRYEYTKRTTPKRGLGAVGPASVPSANGGSNPAPRLAAVSKASVPAQNATGREAVAWRRAHVGPRRAVPSFRYAAGGDVNPGRRIPVYTEAFQGTFDGQGYTIHGLTIERPDEDHVGLFGGCSGDAVITNVALEGGRVEGSNSTGALVGRAANDTEISHSSANVNVSGGGAVGGLVGRSGTIVSCVASGDVEAQSAYVGGLVGRGNTVRDSRATGNVTAPEGEFVGGLVGRDGDITGSHAIGNVVGRRAVGGLAGRARTITNSYATGGVTGVARVGGLAGQVSREVRESYAAGAVRGGVGLVGHKSSLGTLTITDSFATGPVLNHVLASFIRGGLAQAISQRTSLNRGYMAGPWFGGLTYGASSFSGTGEQISRAFEQEGVVWDTETTGWPWPTENAIGLPTEAMMTEKPFREKGWNFDEANDEKALWTMTEGETYPHLAWSVEPGATYELTVTSSGEGTIEVERTSEEGRPWSLVVLKANAGPGHALKGWKGDGLGADGFPPVNPLPLVLHDDREIRAEFAPVIPISTVDDLQRIGNDPQFPLDGNYVLEQDIDASDTANWNNGKGFRPLAREEPFTGTFNGRGHAITGLTIAREELDNVGLFSAIGRTGEVSRLALDDLSLTGRLMTGGIAAENLGGRIVDCAVSGAVTSSDFSEHSVWKNGAGGITGHNKGLIWRAHSEARVMGEVRAGGVAGNSDGIIVESRALGHVEGSEHVGGVAGRNEALIVDSYSVAPVEGGFGVGGVVGKHTGRRHGAFVWNSHAAGPVSGEAVTGGIAGADEEDPFVWGSFWNTDATGQTVTAGPGGIGLSTEEMASRSTFEEAGWDFKRTWTMDEEGSHPTFRFEFGYPLPDDQAAQSTRRMRGDVNGNSEVTALDIQLLINAVLGLDVPEGPEYRYVFSDPTKANPSAEDIQIVINAVLGIE